METIIVDEDTGSSTVQLVMRDGFLKRVDSWDNDRVQVLLVNWHLNGHMRTSEPRSAGSGDVRANSRVAARIGDNSSDWSKQLKEISEDDNDEELVFVSRDFMMVRVVITYQSEASEEWC